MSKKSVRENHQAVATVFNSVVTEVKQVVDSKNHKSAVDVELNFNQVTVSSRGIPLFTKKRKETAMTIRLATRITPE